MNPEDYNVSETVTRYRDMKHFANGMYLEAIWQYRDMARGGDGGELGFEPSDRDAFLVNSLQPLDAPVTCRAYNYPGYPDSFFRAVLDRLNEA